MNTHNRLYALLLCGLALLVLLVAGVFGFGIAIQQRIIALPELDVRFSQAHLVAYVTHTPDCAPILTYCLPELIRPPAQDYYVIWVVTRTGEPAPPDERETDTRLLTLPLRQP
jgi:hypothetical protein